ncbi:MAG: NAD(P)H-hydrate dehydratase [Betaproteobacteria bacterium]|nr:NAD(P)H-hydrate dehydratase [Betaproteobacteria bacterium]MCL2887303.1 NAD(P)H-hydrate dehydratase [Betaproteobacteria bacterium]
MNTDLYLGPSLRALEQRHAEDDLMRRAGTAAADWAGELALPGGLPVLVVAGPGNNGGDALVAARLLRERFFAVTVVFAGDTARLPADAATAWQDFTAAGGSTVEVIPERQRWALVIDGLFGIGLGRPPEGRHAALIEAINHIAERDRCPVLALDCPSGLDAERGAAPGVVVRATHTLTFIAGKPGLLTADGPDYCGQIRLARLDLDPPAELPPDGRCITPATFAEHLLPRQRNSHKGNFGSVGVVGGAPSMVGAAFLAARAALKLGAGRVYAGLIDPQAPDFDPLQPELMLRRPQALLQTPLTALACGPGLGISLEASELVETAIALDLPLLLDADALNLVGSEENLQQALAKRRLPALLTPHPGEAGRLLEIGADEVQADRLAAAREIARRYRCHVALKGCGTVVATVDGQWWINDSGNSGMATAGMGDVLSGLVLALLGQGWPPVPALLAGVHLHGAAADRLVAAGIGPVGLTASEIADAARLLFNDWLRQPPRWRRRRHAVRTVYNAHPPIRQSLAP